MKKNNVKKSISGLSLVAIFVTQILAGFVGLISEASAAQSNS